MFKYFPHNCYVNSFKHRLEIQIFPKKSWLLAYDNPVQDLC